MIAAGLKHVRNVKLVTGWKDVVAKIRDSTARDNDDIAQL
jgi:hypothetical protein